MSATADRSQGTERTPEGTAISYTNLTMPSRVTSNHGVDALVFILLSYSLCLFFSQKIYKLPWQPYISTLIDMCPFHSTGRKSTYRALIGGFKWWKTGVFWSVFPENSYNENSSVNLSGYCWFYRMFVIAQTTGYIAVQLIIIRKTKYAIQSHEIM